MGYASWRSANGAAEARAQRGAAASGDGATGLVTRVHPTGPGSGLAPRARWAAPARGGLPTPRFSRSRWHPLVPAMPTVLEKATSVPGTAPQACGHRAFCRASPSPTAPTSLASAAAAGRIRPLGALQREGHPQHSAHGRRGPAPCLCRAGDSSPLYLRCCRMGMMVSRGMLCARKSCQVQYCSKVSQSRL